MTRVAPVDVAVIGGGPAGSAVSAVLAPAGYDVVVVERRPKVTERIGEILPPSIQQPLAALGVWPAFLSGPHLPAVGQGSSWGGDDVVHRDFLADPYGNGWHVDRACFDQMLQDAARGAGARIELGTALVRAERSSIGWDLALRSTSGPSQIGARFVVDASGRSRSFARLIGVGQDRTDAMVACFTYVATPEAAVVETLVEATRDGWWYAAPLPGRRSIVAFLTDGARLARGGPGDLAAQLPPAIAARIPPLAPGAPLRKVAADSSRLRLAAADRWIAVGDAAATHDPLAAQGIDRALRSGLRAAEAIALAMHDRPSALHNYAAMQRGSFATYLQLRRRFYALERRWPGAGFWSERSARPG